MIYAAVFIGLNIFNLGNAWQDKQLNSAWPSVMLLVLFIVIFVIDYRLGRFWF